VADVGQRTEDVKAMSETGQHERLLSDEEFAAKAEIQNVWEDAAGVDDTIPALNRARSLLTEGKADD
jgi:hypothetical protein